ncbi:MAG: hypothetical protein IJI43_03475 [Bacilli bacterium]|nr:hypothetical protein [Bacilli bacterium]
MKKRYKSKIVFVILVVLCIAFLVSRATYSSYESEVSGKSEADVADWRIKINEVLVSDEVGKELDLDDVTWNNQHVKTGKIAPGASGAFNIKLDFTGTEVAVRYDLEIIDKSVDSDKILTLTSISHPNITLTRTGVNTYTGIVTKAELDSSPIRNLALNMTWVNDDTVNDLETEAEADDYLEVLFSAVQYRGEAIVPYTG